jgi:hypothetical protein
MFSFSNFCCFTFMSLSHSARHLSGNCGTKDGSLTQALPGCRAAAVDTRTTGTYENCHQNTLRNINTTTVTADRTKCLNGVAMFRYLGATVTNENDDINEIKSQAVLGTAQFSTCTFPSSV